MLHKFIFDCIWSHIVVARVKFVLTILCLPCYWAVQKCNSLPSIDSLVIVVEWRLQNGNVRYSAYGSALQMFYSLTARKTQKKPSASWTIVGLMDVPSTQSCHPSPTSVKPVADSMRWGALSLKRRIVYCNIYRVAQKSKPLSNYQKIVLNRIKVCQWD